MVGFGTPSNTSGKRGLNIYSNMWKTRVMPLFPIIIKPNVGGSGAGILKFNTKKELKEFVKLNSLNMGIDHTALVQEYLPARNNSVVRIEILNEQFLYAIKLLRDCDFACKNTTMDERQLAHSILADICGGVNA